MVASLGKKIRVFQNRKFLMENAVWSGERSYSTSERERETRRQGVEEIN